MNKIEIIDKILNFQEELLNKSQVNLNTIHSEADIDEMDTLDPEDFSHQSEATELEHLLKMQSTHFEVTINALQKFKTLNVNNIESGALVETNDYIIVVGTSFKPFSLNNKTVLGIELNVPFYQEIKDLSVGDTFVLKDKTQTINKIA